MKKTLYIVGFGALSLIVVGAVSGLTCLVKVAKQFEDALEDLDMSF